MTNELRLDRSSMQDPTSSSTYRPTSMPTRPVLPATRRDRGSMSNATFVSVAGWLSTNSTCQESNEASLS